MELKTNQMPQPTSRGNLNDPKEKERILMQYGGIFKRAIPEFAKKVIKNKKQKTNYSR
jgi:hypothetical protein